MDNGKERTAVIEPLRPDFGSSSGRFRNRVAEVAFRKTKRHQDPLAPPPPPPPPPLPLLRIQPIEERHRD